MGFNLKLLCNICNVVMFFALLGLLAQGPDNHLQFAGQHIAAVAAEQALEFAIAIAEVGYQAPGILVRQLREIDRGYFLLRVRPVIIPFHHVEGSLFHVQIYK